jgi:hypothetical protein
MRQRPVGIDDPVQLVATGRADELMALEQAVARAERLPFGRTHDT